MSNGDIIMSQKEVLRHEIIISLDKKILRQITAAEKLGISVRQVGRLYKKYKSNGVAGLISKKRGKGSNIYQEVFVSAGIAVIYCTLIFATRLLPT